MRKLFAAILLALGCRVAEVRDACDLDPALCLPCASDVQCVLGGNPCLEELYCSHEDAGVAVIQIGCSKALEYRWPDGEGCVCGAEGVCGWEE